MWILSDGIWLVTIVHVTILEVFSRLSHALKRNYGNRKRIARRKKKFFFFPFICQTFCYSCKVLMPTFCLDLCINFLKVLFNIKGSSHLTDTLTLLGNSCVLNLSSLHASQVADYLQCLR